RRSGVPARGARRGARGVQRGGPGDRGRCPPRQAVERAPDPRTGVRAPRGGVGGMASAARPLLPGTVRRRGATAVDGHHPGTYRTRVGTPLFGGRGPHRVPRGLTGTRGSAHAPAGTTHAG